MRNIDIAHPSKLNWAARWHTGFSPEIEIHKETLNYHEHYRATVEEIYKEYYKARNEGYNPKKLLLGVETYKQLVSVLTYDNHGLTMPKEFLDMEIIIRQGHYEHSIEVVCSIQEEMSKAYWRKNK
jgi:hypothetical protein